MFLGADSLVVAIARHIQLLATWNFLLFGVALVLFGTVRANRAVLAPLIILAVSLIPVRLGFGILAPPWLGADALRLIFPVSAVVDLVLAAGYYLHGGWRKQTMIAPSTPPNNCHEQAITAAQVAGRDAPTG